MASGFGSMESKGDDYVKQAEGALGRFSLFGIGSAKKNEDAATAYAKAGNAYKAAKHWDAAGSAYKKSAELYNKLGEEHEASLQFANAAGCYKHSNTGEAIAMLRTVIPIYEEAGKFRQAGKLYNDIAAIYEDDGKLNEAIDVFQRAADSFNCDTMTSEGTKALEKVAELSAIQERYQVAVDVYEQIGTSSMSNPLIKYGAKAKFLLAGLCMLASGDPVAARTALEKYSGIDPTFETSREGKFLAALITCVEESDSEQFSDVVYNYDKVSKLSSFHTTILLRIKKAIQEAAGELEPDLK